MWEPSQLDSVELLADAVTSQAVYFNVLFPSKYRYYFELVSNSETPILIDHPFRLYFPQTVTVEWADSGGIYLILGADPEFHPWGPLVVQIHIPMEIYDAIINALTNPINSPSDLVPPPEGNAMGEVEFVLLSADTGEQIKIDMVNSSYTPEIPITVKTLQWNEVLYDVMSLELSPAVTDSSSFEFAYTVSGVLGITFIDPRYCFLREWVAFPAEWTNVLKDFAGIQ